jgi:hypothetical protein
MYRRMVFVAWAILAWVTPAAIAGALGWKGIWGSGGAFADYLIPFPVAGGVFHVPSFIVVSLVLATQPWAGRLGGFVRGLLLAGAGVGIATLLDLNKLQLAATTDMLGGRFWQEQPIGLFILTDCVIAQWFVGVFGGRSPQGSKEWWVSLIAVLVIPAAYTMASLKADPRQQNPFVHASAVPTGNRGDERVFIYSKLPLGSAEFRQAATDLLAQYDPRSNINAEDIAIHFFDSLAPAQSRDWGAARYTVCLYQDGTPTTWNPGSFDCHAAHESFTERLHKVLATQDAALPPDVRFWLARRDTCAARKPLVAPPGVHMDNQEIRLCDPAGTARSRDELLKKFETDANALAALR